MNKERHETGNISISLIPGHRPHYSRDRPQIPAVSGTVPYLLTERDLEVISQLLIEGQHIRFRALGGIMYLRRYLSNFKG